MVGTAYSLTWGWETVQEAAKRLGTTDTGALALWIVEQVNRGLAQAGEIRDHTGWVLPVFRKVNRQPSLFE